MRATVTGRVQGVFFRETTKRRALEIGVRGWVRNQDDGSVLVHAEGPKPAVERMADFLAQGPPSARVEAVDARPAKVEGHEQFAVRGVPVGRFTVWEEAEEAGGRYALGLEVGDSLRVWRLPKQPSMDPADKRLAIEQPAGASGADPESTVWDEGPYEQGGRVPWPEAIDERGHAVFVLHGERLKGGFALQRTGAGRWLLIKRRQ